MITKSKFLGRIIDWIIEYIVVPIDGLLATPFNNAELFYGLGKSNNITYSDSAHPYPNINNSPDAMSIKGGAIGVGLVSVIANFIIRFYQRLRKKEAGSNYFFFEKLPGIGEHLEARNKEDKKQYPSEILLAAAYYYNPDLPSFVLKWRRVWATLTRNSLYFKLKKYLDQQDAIFQKINEILAFYITEKGKYGSWIVEKKGEKYVLICVEKSEFLESLKNKEAEGIKEEKKKTIAQRVWKFFEAGINDLEKASYVFWIGVFIFYLLPGVGLIGAVVWPPILIASIFLLGLWISKCLIKAIQARKKGSQLNEDIVSVEEINELPETVKQIQIEAIPEKKVRFFDSKSYENSSELYKDGVNIIQKRKSVVYVGAILSGFTRGFFKISFILWLFFSAIGLAVSISPVGLAIIAGGTVLLGIACGIYSACQKLKSDDKKLDESDKRLEELETLNSEVPNISLREYNRLFRRGDPNKTAWTTTKQTAKRAWVFFTGVGTGILVLKLSSLGLATAVLTALGMTTGVVFFPMLAVLLTGGFLYAAWCVYQYHLESQKNQFDNVMNSLAHWMQMQRGEPMSYIEANNSSDPNAEESVQKTVSQVNLPEKNIGLDDEKINTTIINEDSQKSIISTPSFFQLRRVDSAPADLFPDKRENEEFSCVKSFINYA